MNVALIGTKTGHGHIAVLNAIKSRLIKTDLNLFIENSFPEEKLLGYDFLSDFYNYLLSTSLELSNKFTEMLVYSRSDKSEKFVTQSKSSIIRYLEDNNIDFVISFAPFLNYALYNAVKAMPKKVQLATVFTDPFIPYMVGFDCPYFDYYYISDDMVKSDLMSKGIDEKKILNFGFPVSESYFSIDFDSNSNLINNILSDSKKIVICNCGAEGNPLFLKYIKPLLLLNKYINCIFICGKNKFLRSSVENIISHSNNSNIIVTGFVENMPDLLRISDLIITKPGANIVFESLHSKVPIYADISSGILYQEKGIVNYIKSNKLGIINNEDSQIDFNLNLLFTNSVLLDSYKQNIVDLNLIDSGAKIANHIITLKNNL